MEFKRWFNLIETFDNLRLRGILLDTPQTQDKEELAKFVKELEESPTVYNKQQAFAALKARFNIISNTATPTDLFLKKYFDKKNNKQISPDEYKTLEHFFKPNIDKNLLTEMMTKLRELIVQKKIKLIFNGKPQIRFQNTILDDYTDLITFVGIIHAIEGSLKTPTEEADLQNPAFLELSHTADLKAKSNKIWVFKGDDPVKCRIMGKGQDWCISSSTSVVNYFGYRHDHGQTQYFIFDFNKDVDDPARYVNPGVAPKGGYSEWVDKKNKPKLGFSINGYTSLQEYLVYLRSKGIDTDIFVADPITEDEKKLKDYVDSEDFAGARNHSEKMFYFYLKLVNKLNDKQFNLLTDDQKKEFLIGKENLTADQFDYLSKLSPKLFKEYINSIKEIVKLLKYAALFANKDTMAKLIVNNKKDLNDADVYNLLLYATDKDEMAELLGKDNINKLLDLDVEELVKYATDRYAMIKLIIKYKKDLTCFNIKDFIHYTRYKIEEILRLLGPDRTVYLHCINKLSDHEIFKILEASTDKDAIATLIINNKKDLTDDNINFLLDYAPEVTTRELGPERIAAYKKNANNI